MRRLGIALSLAAVCAVGMALLSPPPWLFDLLARLHPGCLYRVPMRARLVALTIDDGPDARTTPPILAELKRHRSRATFFLISDRISGREAVVRAVVEAGQELGNHLTRDEPSIGLSPVEFERSLTAAHRVLVRYGPVAWARPGSGWYTPAMLDVMARHGYRCALGSVYPFDAALPSVPWASSYILRNVRPGAVIVLHDHAARGVRTAAVLRRVLPELRARGYRIVTLSELVRAGQAGARSAAPPRGSRRARSTGSRPHLLRIPLALFDPERAS